MQKQNEVTQNMKPNRRQWAVDEKECETNNTCSNWGAYKSGSTDVEGATGFDSTNLKIKNEKWRNKG